MKFRAQSSVEYLFIVAFVIFVVGFLFSVSNDIAQKKIQFESLSSSALSLTQAANEVYALGPGSQKLVRISLPSGIQKSIVSGKEIGWTYSVYGAGTGGTATYLADGNVQGYLPMTAGIYDVLIQLDNSGTVKIGQGLSIQPELFAREMTQGSVYVKTDYNLANLSDLTVNGITPSIDSSLNGMIGISNLPSSLNSGTSGIFTVTITVPSNAATKMYEGAIIIKSNQGLETIAWIQINVGQELGDVNVLTYGDSGYTGPANSFVFGDTVFFEVRTADENGSLMNADLNTFLKNPAGSTVNQELEKTTADGFYQSSFVLSCNSGNQGNWNIQATGKKINTVTDQNVFAVNGSNANGNFVHSWSTAQYTEGGEIIRNWGMENASNCATTTITHMKVSWTNDPSNRIEKIRLNGQQVFSGSASTGTWINITDFNIPKQTVYQSNGNRLEFDGDIDDVGEVVTLDYNFSDGTIYTSSGFP
ncbi:MAG: hypothetical protein Q7S92_02180 [Candidatus Diapherotrites archaeon]|nr:hypothetical protein [Candidatus Diapherotrites archaeon]